MSEQNIVMQGVSIEELEKLIQKSVRKSYYDITCDLQDKYEREDLLTREETAQFLKINLSTLYYWTKKGKLNSYGIANRRYYKKSEILDRLNLYQVPYQ